MPVFIEEYFVLNLFAFILCFVRVGTMAMIMPGIGDTFTPARIRLHMALGLSLVLSPILYSQLPAQMPATGPLLVMIITEFIIGLFMGAVARFFMAALDVAGMVISFSSSLSNAQLFNPGLATQGSLVGAFLSITGMVIIFASNLHHLLIMGMMDSYNLFPVGNMPDTGSMAEFMAKALSQSFLIGIQIGAPFLVLMLLLYMAMGVLSRLMPQVQVFLLALPLQVLLSLILMSLILSAGFIYWIGQFESAMAFFLGGVAVGDFAEQFGMGSF